MNDTPERQNEAVYINTSTNHEDSRFVRSLRSNVESDLIEITEDKLENILLKHLENLNVRDSWLSPLSLLTAVVAAKTTATFNDAFGLKAPVWEAIFVLVGFGALIWLVRNIIRIARKWDQCSIDSLMSLIKNSQDAADS